MNKKVMSLGFFVSIKMYIFRKREDGHLVLSTFHFDIVRPGFKGEFQLKDLSDHFHFQHFCDSTLASI